MTDVTDKQLPLGAGVDAADVAVVPAATTIVLRGDPFEVLLMRRHERSTFVPGSWVFPGGAVEDGDRKAAKAMGLGEDILSVMKISAVRELFVETGIWPAAAPDDLPKRRETLLHAGDGFADLFSKYPVDLDRLVWTARWITPSGVRKRYDTYFFLAQVPENAEATPDEREGVEVVWLTPGAALDRHRRGELPMVFPTMKNLEAIAGHVSAVALLSDRRNADVKTTRPILVVEGGQKKIILPDGPS